MSDVVKVRGAVTKRLGVLKSERNSYDSHWRELSDYYLPRRARFLSSDRNKGSKQTSTIINGTPMWAVRVLSSGMMAGVTSPARPWFRLTTPDPALEEAGGVRSWLHIVEERMRQVLATSNLYNCFATVYSDLGVFGTSVLYIEEDDETVVRGYVFPVGQYSLGMSSKLRVDTCYRELSMTVSQVVEAFGLENASNRVKNEYQRGNYDTWVEVVHAIEPDRSKGPQMPWRSVWLEQNSDASKPFLRESGYNEFPVMAPRWHVTAEDTYGWSPGMEGLGDARALQVLERRKGQLIDKLANPPMRGPTSLQHQRVDLLPGGTTYVDAVAQGQSFAPAYEVNPLAVQMVGAEIQRHEERINRAFYADLWLMLASADSPQMTAREVAERHDEKMLQLGPAMDRLSGELLNPCIDRIFAVMLRRGMIPEAPEELEGQELKVEYLSIMAQAQKLLGTSAVERLATFASSIAQVKPDILDKVDFDQVVDEYSNMLGVAPEMVRPDEAVVELRQQRAKAVEQQQALEQANVAAQGAKTLSETTASPDNALGALIGALGPGSGVGGA